MEKINVQDMVEKLKSDDLDATDVINELQKLIVTGSSEDNLNTLTQIASGLRKHARDTDNIRFFYFGMFQAWVDTLRARLKEEAENEEKRAQTKMARFDDIIEYINKNGTVKRLQMAADLKIDPSHLSRKLNSLTDAGFINQRKIGSIIYYSLTPSGAHFLSERQKQKNELVIHCSECQWFSKQGYEEDNKGIEPDLQSGFCQTHRQETQACRFCSSAIPR